MPNRAVKYQLFPTEEQAQLIRKTVGCTRFVYNNLLDDYNSQLQQGIAKPKIKLVTFLKQNNTFLNEVDSLALMNGRAHLETALKNFFDSKSGKRKGREVGFPTKKKKHKAKLSYTTNNQHGTVRIEGNAVKLPKVGFVKFKCHRIFDGEIKSVTITQTRDGVYYASVLFEFEGEIKAKPIKPYNELKVVGIDMSMKEFAVDSEGENASPTKPKFERNYRKNEKKIARLEKEVSRKEKGSKNRGKARARLAKFSRHIANKRLDFTHKLSRYYVNNYDVIVVEDIDMQAMSRMLKLGKSVCDLGFGQFREQLAYKCMETDSVLIVADKWFASSKTCHECGSRNPGLKLSDRVWVCPVCGCILDRDYNAALNLRDYFTEVISEEKYKNTVGTAEIHASGEKTATLREVFSQVSSLNEEKKPLNL